VGAQPAVNSLTVDLVPGERLLLDLGGVLTVDPWESLVLTPRRGIADRLDLDRALVERVGSDLWQIHARSVTSEEMYWQQFAQRVSAYISPALLAEAERELLVTTPDALRMVECLRAGGRPWGLITNNTAFWYPKQLALLGMTHSEPQWQFTSFAAGTVKDDTPGLFDLAARTVDPAGTIIIDDRLHNVERARVCGFQATMYRVGDEFPQAMQC
jgi:beta-phosphoglucomutase-like phosphatase (HAD superfamily)